MIAGLCLMYGYLYLKIVILCSTSPIVKRKLSEVICVISILVSSRRVISISLFPVLHNSTCTFARVYFNHVYLPHEIIILYHHHGMITRTCSELPALQSNFFAYLHSQRLQYWSFWVATWTTLAKVSTVIRLSTHLAVCLPIELDVNITNVTRLPPWREGRRMLRPSGLVQCSQHLPEQIMI